METADAMVYGGFREAGYQYVCIDVRDSIQYEIFTIKINGKRRRFDRTSVIVKSMIQVKTMNIYV